MVGVMTTWLTPTELGAWRRFVLVTNLLPARITASLQPHGLQFFEYMILAMLSDAPDRTLSMGRLAELTSASPSRLSHAVRRLEQRNLVERAVSEGDRRVTLATLTVTGLATMEEVAPDHVANVREVVFDVLTSAQVDQLGEISGALLERLAPDLAPPWGSVDEW